MSSVCTKWMQKRILPAKVWSLFGNISEMVL